MATFTLRQAVDDFLTQKHIAVAGVSRNSGEAANSIYRKLRDAGYAVFATNPKAKEVEGDPCYPDLKSIPEKIDGVVIATPPGMSESVVAECAALGIRRVWLHRSFGTGSVSEKALLLCQDQGISVIPGGCPLMFCEPVDAGHRCMRWILKLTGGLPAPR
jgi:predicted CoA-binding protein